MNCVIFTRALKYTELRNSMAKFALARLGAHAHT